MARKFRKSYASPRALAVEKGAAKPGRGRFSAKAHALIAEAREKGVVFKSEVEPVAPVAPVEG